MNNMIKRPRRLRYNHAVRSLVRETVLSVDDFIYPLFIVPGQNIKSPIKSLNNQFHLSADKAAEEAQKAWDMGLKAVLLFGLPSYKDDFGSSGADPQGPVPQAIRQIKSKVPQLLVITDVCLCEYTTHGHCGVIKNHSIDNDSTLPLLADQALMHVKEGADMVAPSDMMDGRVGVIRQRLDNFGFKNIPIMSYSVKYSSAYYGPFREAANSAPAFGDRKSYQMDPANRLEALREVALDESEGADIIMVKPAGPYLDVIRDVRSATNLPLAAYQVSGEYAMIEAAAELNLVDRKAAAMESLTAIKRAGANLIITYYALDAINWLEGKL